MRERSKPVRQARSRLRWLPPVAALAVSLAFSYGAYRLASYSWDQVVSYESPYTNLSGADFSGVRPELSSPIPGAEARRTVVVLIDGLRDDASRTMASVSGLRARGADVALTVPQPSLSYPSWTTVLTGAPQQISGVTTNWFEGPVKVETLLDVASGSGRRVVVSGTSDLGDLFNASEVAAGSALIEWDEDAYTSDTIVNNALELDEEVAGAGFIFVLLPDVDNAGHDFGGASDEYAEVVSRVDADLARLIEGLDDGNTVFAVLPDHGHIDTGGHGGWEESATSTFAAFAGPGVAQATASGRLEDVAPTIAVLAGMQAPLQGTGTAIDAVLADENGSSRDAEFVRSAGITLAYVRKVLGEQGVRGLDSIGAPGDLAQLREDADARRLTKERDGRLAVLAGAVAVALAFWIFLGVTSWRTLLGSLAGTAAYFALYNALFFGVRGLRWSLSAFNEESLIDAFFNQRMLDAALSGLFACLVAALVYLALRMAARGPRQGLGVETLTLGGATVISVQAALALQVAYFLWRWGAQVSWILPDMGQAFKYDLDLIQLTALGAAAVLGPVVTWTVARLRTRTRVAGA